MTGINSYSTTASENIQANTGVNWDEGMAPGQVNNSARQNMADLRLAFDDLIWFQYGIGSKTVAPVYASATSFTLAGGDATAVWHAARRVKAVGSSTGTIYGAVSSSSFASTTTTVNVAWDTGALANEALTIYLSQLPVTGAPLGANALVGTIAGDNAKPGSVGERPTCVSKDNASNSCTMSIASPGVVTQVGHGYSLAQVLNFTTTGSLPAGIAAGATCYVIPIDANTFNLASSVANALAGTKISTSGSQSGAHSANGWAIWHPVLRRTLAGFCSCLATGIFMRLRILFPMVPRLRTWWRWR